MCPASLHPRLPKKLTNVEQVTTLKQLTRDRVYRSTCPNSMRCTYSTLKWNIPITLTGHRSIFFFFPLLYIKTFFRRARIRLLQTHAPQSLIHFVRRRHALHAMHKRKLILFTLPLHQVLKQQTQLPSLHFVLPVALSSDKLEAVEQLRVSPKLLPNVSPLLMQYTLFSPPCAKYFRNSIAVF